MTSTQGPLTIEQELVRTLSDRITGDVITPVDPRYDETRHITARHLEQRPAVIVRPRDTDDVSAAIAFARDNGLQLAVRSGGHSFAAHSTVADGLVIDVRDLDTVEVDVDERTAWAGGGTSAGAFTTAVGRHGLVAGFGDTASVGIAGITLAGGAGVLSRRYGLTIDNLLAVELVTAEGRVVVADDETHPELFWALRGGGGNFGVVTRLKYRLHPLPEVVAGMLVLPATVDTVTEFMRLALAAPEELTTIVNVMTAPPLPFLPPEQHGRLVILAVMTYAGPASEAEPVLAPFRALAPPIADFLQPMPYAGLFQGESPESGPIGVNRVGFARTFDRANAQVILETVEARVAGPDVQLAAVQLRPLGGAVSRVAPEATAFAHREWPVMFNVAAVVGSTDQMDAQVPWLEALAASLADGTPGAYAGFAPDEPDRIHAIYPPETLSRLTRVKDEWDPDNVFRRNHTISPTR